MANYAKAGIGTLFLGITVGAMALVMIWGLLSMIHANNIIILSGEAMGLIGLLVLSVPVFKLILKNERGNTQEVAFEEPVIKVDRPKSSGGPKPTAFV